MGQATKQYKLAEEIYAEKLEQLKNIKKNLFYEKNTALATQQLERAANQLEAMKAQKVREENQVFYYRQMVLKRQEQEADAVKVIKSFTSAEKHWALTSKPSNQTEFTFFVNSMCFFPKVDTTTIVTLNLSNSSMDDSGAYTMAQFLSTDRRFSNLKSLDVSGNKFSEVGNKYFAQAAKNVQQPIKIVVDTIVNGLQKQLALGFGSKEAKQNIIKDWLKVGQDNGMDVKNVTVSKDIFDIIVNYGKLQYNFTMGYAKCNIVPESVKSFTADQVIATASKKAGVINTIIGAVTCYFETLDKEMSSQEGVQFITDIRLVGQDELINSVE